MLVLDLDLDVFVSPVSAWSDDVSRPRDADYRVPTPAEASRWLHDRLLLPTATVLPGAVMADHGEAFFVWRDAIRAGQLETPFDLVHLQAHSDFSFGPGRGFEVALDRLLARPVEEREGAVLKSSRLVDSGNYLLLAIACGWVRRLVHVYSAGLCTHAPLFLRDFGRRRDRHRLVRYTENDDVEERLVRYGSRDDCFEPPVPFRALSTNAFDRVEALPRWARRRADWMTVATSPRYTPPALDRVADILKQCIIAPQENEFGNGSCPSREMSG